MIEYTSGDILKCRVDAMVNTVNSVDAMGRGIALQLKRSSPHAALYRQFSHQAALTRRKPHCHPCATEWPWRDELEQGARPHRLKWFVTQPLSLVRRLVSVGLGHIVSRRYLTPVIWKI